MSGGDIRCERQGAIATIWLDRPARRNALTPDMLGALTRETAALSSGVACLVLAGEGPVFCAGFDLALCRDHPDGSAMRSLLTGLSRAITALRALPIPVVAAVQGAAIAGGCALLGGADLVVADRDAKFGYPVVRLGVSPAVSAPFLAEAVGGGCARERLLDPALIDARAAFRIGLVHEIVDSPGDVLPQARRVAESLADKPRHAMAATRAWVRGLATTESGAPAALAASLSLTGGEEERARVAAARRAQE